MWWCHQVCFRDSGSDERWSRQVRCRQVTGDDDAAETSGTSVGWIRNRQRNVFKCHEWNPFKHSTFIQALLWKALPLTSCTRCVECCQRDCAARAQREGSALCRCWRTDSGTHTGPTGTPADVIEDRMSLAGKGESVLGVTRSCCGDLVSIVESIEILF